MVEADIWTIVLIRMWSPNQQMDQLILAKLVSRSSSPNQHINRLNLATYSKCQHNRTIDRNRMKTCTYSKAEFLWTFQSLERCHRHHKPSNWYESMLTGASYALWWLVFFSTWLRLLCSFKYPHSRICPCRRTKSTPGVPCLCFNSWYYDQWYIF
jgi:hypothetical protein